MKNNILSICAKEPVPGNVKTRLCPPLSFEQAAELYTCFLKDTIDAVKNIPNIDCAIAYTPESRRKFFEECAPEDFILFPQEGDGLTDRVINMFDYLFDRGYTSCCLINSDSPGIPTEFLKKAFDMLGEKSDVVLGPSKDGGYYLVGFHGKTCSEIFKDIPWSTENVFHETMQKIKKHGLKSNLLPFWSDLDTFEELARFKAMIQKENIENVKRTTDYLLRMDTV